MTNPILDAYYSLARRVNKKAGQTNDEIEEGIVSEKMPELKLEMSNEDLASLTAKWNKKWTDSDIKAEWDKKGDENEKYWLGEQYDTPKGDKSRPAVDNVIFEGLETYLPQITRHNPDPMVDIDDEADVNDEHTAFAKKLQKKLGRISDKISLRLKLKKAGRHWAIFLLGVGKMGWDLDRNIPTLKIVRGKKLILDPDAVNDEDGYSGKYIGEYRKMEAGMLIDTLTAIEGETDGIAYIKGKVGDALGTDIQFQEWWTNEYLCWELEGRILLKKKNPHWNYAQKEPQIGEDGQPVIGEDGQPIMQDGVAATNHFATPRKPWILLTVFNLGRGPVDVTSLIGQNLSNQDVVNKRNKQIDKNADSMNGGMVVSGERSGLTQQQSKGVTDALRKGGTVYIPSGAVSDAIARMSAPSLPQDIYLQLTDMRTRTRDIFGTRGSSPAGNQNEKTVRGKMQNQMFDTDRIGGGFSEYLEQFADEVYNWMVQLIYVYDEEYAGKQHPAVNVSVKEGSLLPKDSTTIANQAIDLASAGKLSTIDLFKALDKPNPEELAANIWLEINAPEILFANDPRVAQVIQQRQQAAQPEKKEPSQSISYKDLPPDAQAQMLAKVGIVAHPEAIAAHDEHTKDTDAARSMSAVPQPATAVQ